MNKILSMFLILCFIFTLIGCGKKTDSADAPTTEPSADPTESVTQATDESVPQENAVEQLPMFAVALPLTTEKTFAEDGTEIFSTQYQDISLTVTDPEIADKIILDYLNRTNIHDQAEQVLALAKQSYSEDAAYFTPYLAKITFKPVRIDSGVLSMFGVHTTYSGGGHGEYVFTSVTYDLVNGDALSLGSILTQNATEDVICGLVLSALSEQKEDEQLFEGYEDLVKDGFSRNYKQITDWYFSDTGLCFFYSPYEIAPFAAGEVIAEIPYSQLTGILKDDYFPVESERVSGTVVAEVFSDSALQRFTQFAEVTLDKDGEQFLLYTDKSVYDVRLETVSWLTDGTSYSADNTVFAAYTLTPGDAIVIKALLSETMPGLLLSYKTGDQTVSYLVGYDGQNGTVTLNEA